MPSEHAAVKLKRVLRGLKPVQRGNKLEIPTLTAWRFAESSAFYPPALKLQPNKKMICIKRRTLACVKKQKYPVRTSLKPNNRTIKRSGHGLRDIRSTSPLPNNRAAKPPAKRLTERTASPASSQIAELQKRRRMA